MRLGNDQLMLVLYLAQCGSPGSTFLLLRGWNVLSSHLVLLVWLRDWCSWCSAATGGVGLVAPVVLSFSLVAQELVCRWDRPISPISLTNDKTWKTALKLEEHIFQNDMDSASLFRARTSTLYLNWRNHYTNRPLCQTEEETLEHFLLDYQPLQQPLATQNIKANYSADY